MPRRARILRIDTLSPNTMKTCSKCDTEKHESEFNKNSAAPDGLRPYCRACSKTYWSTFVTKNREKRNTEARERRRQNPVPFREANRKCHIKAKYGLTPESFAALLAAQNGQCACCGDGLLKTPHIDHIHGSSPAIVRGLVCSGCNTGIGQFKESTFRLRKAIQYLRRHGG